jgi:hypothetical protein
VGLQSTPQQFNVTKPQRNKHHGRGNGSHGVVAPLEEEVEEEENTEEEEKNLYNLR